MITPQAIDAREVGTRTQGDLVAIVTATNEFITRPIADAFGVPELLAVELERDAGGAVTGAIKGVPTYQDGKVVRVEALAGRRKGLAWGDFERVSVYSDSINDLPLLARATDACRDESVSPRSRPPPAERGWRLPEAFRMIRKFIDRLLGKSPAAPERSRAA